MDIAKLNVVIGANISDFEREVKTLEKGIGQLGNKLKSAGETMTKFVTLPIALVAGAALKAAGDMQALEKGFGAVYKGAGDLGTELKKVKEVAKLPGLGLKEAIQGSINLQAAGFSAEQARNALTGFGNALATVGKGKADLEGVTTALSQMAAKGKLSAEEINQIAERVPQIRQVMKDAFGTADTEQLSKMGITVNQFVDKVTTELNKLPKVTGGISNAFENMADTGILALSSLGTAINNNFNVEGKFNAVSDALAGIVDGFNNLSPTTQKVILVVGGLIAVAGPLILAVGTFISILPVLTVGLTKLGVAFTAATGPVGVLVFALGAAAFVIVTHMDEIRLAAAKAANGIADALNSMTNSLTKFDVGLRNTLGKAAESVGANSIANFFYEGAAASQTFGQSIQAAKLDLDNLDGASKNVSKTFAEVGQSFFSFGQAAAFAAAQNAMYGKVITTDQIPIFQKLNDKIKEQEAIKARALEGDNKTIAAANIRIAQIQEEIKRLNELGTVKEKALKIAELERVNSSGPAAIRAINFDTDTRTLEDLLGIKKSEKLDAESFLPGMQAFAASLEPVKEQILETQSIWDIFKDKVSMGGMEIGVVIADGLVGAFDALTSAISTTIESGGNLFDNIVKELKDFSKTFGKYLLKYGAGMIASGNFVLGGAALVAGGALLAFGGAGGSSSPATGGASSGSAYKSPAARSSFTAPSEAVSSRVEFSIKGTELVGVLRKQGYKDGR